MDHGVRVRKGVPILSLEWWKYITCHKTEEDRTMATSNMHKRLVKFSCVDFELCKWTDRQTHILITILCTLLAAKEKHDTVALLYEQCCRLMGR